jgi:hypothetical protein
MARRSTRSSAGQSGYSPLNWLDHIRLRAAMKHLHSRYHSVRVAAHKEIQQILHKRRGVKTRIQRGWQRMWDRVSYGKLQRCPVNDCRHSTREPAVAAQHARQHAMAGMSRGQAPSPFQQARQAAERRRARQPQREFTAVTWEGDGTHHPRSEGRQNGQQPDAMAQHTASMQRAHAQPPAPRYPYAGGRVPAPGELARIHRAEAAEARTGHDFGAAAEHERLAEEASRRAAAREKPARAAVPEAPAGAPVPLPGDEALRRVSRTQDKPRWAGLRRRTTSPRPGRSRSRTA